MSESIKKNFAYRSILTVSSYLVALLTYPYVSRVLGVEYIGLVNFVDNTISYFLLFATMGVNILGIRETAYVKNDKKSLSNVFSNILGINIVFTTTTLAVFYVAVTLIPSFHQYDELFYIGSAKILFSAFLVEWLFTGIENFRYITIRTVIIKIIYAISIFLFIKDPSDYVTYFILTIGVVVVNSVINLIYSRNFIRINVRELISFKYLKADVQLGIYTIMTSMYLSFNVMFLGLSTNNTEVGYYTTAHKVYSVVLGLFSAFTSIMLPRMSSLLSKGDGDTFQQLIYKSFSAMSMFSVPMILCSVVLGPDIIYILSGPGYEGSVLPMRIIMPAVLFVGIAQVLAMQVIAPLKKDKVLLFASIIGASLSVVLNVLLVPNLKSVGSAIVLLSSEFVVTGTYMIYICRTKLIKVPIKIIGGDLLRSIPSVIVCIVCVECLENLFLRFFLAFFTSVSIWLIINFRRLSSVLGPCRIKMTIS